MTPQTSNSIAYQDHFYGITVDSGLDSEAAVVSIMCYLPPLQRQVVGTVMCEMNIPRKFRSNNGYICMIWMALLYAHYI